MSVDTTSLGLDRLSVGERLELIEQIWDSLPQQVTAVDVPQWHVDELAKRLDAAAADPYAGRPWREVLSDLKKSQ